MQLIVLIIELYLISLVVRRLNKVYLKVLLFLTLSAVIIRN